MRNTKALACRLLVLPLTGRARRTAWNVSARPLNVSSYDARKDTLKGEAPKGIGLSRALRQYQPTLKSFFAERRLPQSAGDLSAGASLDALSLSGGESQVLEPLEVARRWMHTEIVVVSGCRSAAGAALPEAGLLELTRAWPAAGARTVVGSRWFTPDDDGAPFSVMYRRLRSQPRRDAGGAPPGGPTGNDPIRGLAFQPALLGGVLCHRK